jgi:hypothetical protein
MNMIILCVLVFVLLLLNFHWNYIIRVDFTKKHKLKCIKQIIGLMIMATSYIILISQLKDKFN